MRKRNRIRRLALTIAVAALVLGACARRHRAPSMSEEKSKVGFASMSFGDALDRAQTENRLVMVDVYTDWCGWCKKLDSETFGDLRVAEALKNVISIRVNAEKGGESVAARYGVRGFPTVLFLSASGDVVRKIEGYVDADEMLRIVSSLRKPA
ncbi:MAG TPA: thioredoxin fold domain-containing protein [Thermoanaerobaculia bacterium]|nr:thioredoxin fold domain-containing protein [Thermoanaerobaculia bacterium]